VSNVEPIVIFPMMFRVPVPGAPLFIDTLTKRLLLLSFCNSKESILLFASFLGLSIAVAFIITKRSQGRLQFLNLCHQRSNLGVGLFGGISKVSTRKIVIFIYGKGDEFIQDAILSLDELVKVLARTGLKGSKRILDDVLVRPVLSQNFIIKNLDMISHNLYIISVPWQTDNSELILNVTDANLSRWLDVLYNHLKHSWTVEGVRTICSTQLYWFSFVINVFFASSEIEPRILSPIMFTRTWA